MHSTSTLHQSRGVHPSTFAGDGIYFFTKHTNTVIVIHFRLCCPSNLYTQPSLFVHACNVKNFIPSSKPPAFLHPEHHFSFILSHLCTASPLFNLHFYYQDYFISISSRIKHSSTTTSSSYFSIPRPSLLSQPSLFRFLHPSFAFHFHLYVKDVTPPPCKHRDKRV